MPAPRDISAQKRQYDFQNGERDFIKLGKITVFKLIINAIKRTADTYFRKSPEKRAEENGRNACYINLSEICEAIPRKAEKSKRSDNTGVFFAIFNGKIISEKGAPKKPAYKPQMQINRLFFKKHLKHKEIRKAVFRM